MARTKTTLVSGVVAAVRAISGGIIAADSATLSDANIDPTLAIDCAKLDTILVGVEIAAGTNPTMTLEALFRDEEAADGLRWKRALLGARPGVTATALAVEDSGALDGTALVELRVFGARKVFLRIKAVTNATSTTGAKILAMPGKVRPRSDAE